MHVLLKDDGSLILDLETPSDHQPVYATVDIDFSQVELRMIALMASHGLAFVGRIHDEMSFEVPTRAVDVQALTEQISQFHHANNDGMRRSANCEVYETKGEAQRAFQRGAGAGVLSDLIAFDFSYDPFFPAKKASANDHRPRPKKDWMQRTRRGR